MWINCIAYYSLIIVVNVHYISGVNIDSFTAVTSGKTDNAVFIYPGEVNLFCIPYKYINNINP